MKTHDKPVLFQFSSGLSGSIHGSVKPNYEDGTKFEMIVIILGRLAQYA